MNTVGDGNTLTLKKVSTLRRYISGTSYSITESWRALRANSRLKFNMLTSWTSWNWRRSPAHERRISFPSGRNSSQSWTVRRRVCKSFNVLSFILNSTWFANQWHSLHGSSGVNCCHKGSPPCGGYLPKMSFEFEILEKIFSHKTFFLKTILNRI